MPRGTTGRLLPRRNRPGRWKVAGNCGSARLDRDLAPTLRYEKRVAGLPADDRRRGNSNLREPQLSGNLRLVRLPRAIGKHHGRSPGEAAIAWVLREPAVTGAIVGARA